VRIERLPPGPPRGRKDEGKLFPVSLQSKIHVAQKLAVSTNIREKVWKEGGKGSTKKPKCAARRWRGIWT